MATTARLTTDAPARTHVFDRVLVGVDSSGASIEAARQAAVLAEHYGRLRLLGVHPPPARIGGESTFDTDALAQGAEEAVANALAAINAPAATSGDVARGFTWSTLIAEAVKDGSTLIVVGSHGQGRLEGILGASTTTELVHKSPSSVLVARPVLDGFPLRVVVGLDGSPSLPGPTRPRAGSSTASAARSRRSSRRAAGASTPTPCRA